MRRIMKYVVVLLLLASYVMAKDMNLADYPNNYKVITASLDSCIMGIDGPDSSYVVHPLGYSRGVVCHLLPTGYIYKGRQHGRMIALTYPHFKKGTVDVDKWKEFRYMIDVVTAH
jgi:hypothetical protein